MTNGVRSRIRLGRRWALIVFGFAAADPSPFGRDAQQNDGVYHVRGQAHQAQFFDDQRQNESQVNRRQIGRDRQVVVRVHRFRVVRTTCGGCEGKRKMTSR